MIRLTTVAPRDDPDGMSGFGTPGTVVNKSAVGFVTTTSVPPIGSGDMTFLKKLFFRRSEPKVRVRVCIECGMPIAEHKDWCSILRTQREYDRKAAAAN